MVAVSWYVSLVVPTYNEAGNVEELARRLFSVAVSNNIDLELVIVDDGSPDGTAGKAESLGYENLVVINRGGRFGLSSAVLEGFRMAKNDVVGIMDGDLSHDPESFPEVVKPVLTDESELSVGSRYVHGGGTSDWGMARIIISRMAGLMARGLTGIKDPTSGFFFTKKGVLEGKRLDTTSWKILLEIIVKCRPKNIVEVPITFGGRKAGESKLSLKEEVNYLKHLLQLYFSFGLSPPLNITPAKE